MKYRPKHIAEYIFLRITAFWASILPYRMTLAVGWLIAFLGFRIFHFRRAETLRRLHLVFGNKYTTKEYNRIAWIAGRNTAFNAIELLINKKTSHDWFDSIFDYGDTVKTLKDQMESGKGGIIAGPHMGTWDLAGRSFGSNGIPIISIVAHQRNPLVNAYFERLRSSAGIESLVRGESGILKSIIKKLRKGEFLAIMPDARQRTPGMELPLLGGIANLAPGTATFAHMTGLPIFPIIITRIGWTQHKMRLLDTIYPDKNLDKKEDIERMMSLVIKNIDREIQADPEQWFWYNSRWVLDPVSE